MQEVKIQCDCGQRYKFDVEPANGRMPFTVNCPICKLDGTAKANEVLRVNGGVPMAPAAPRPAVAPAPLSVAAPPPMPVSAMASTAAAPPPPPSLGAPKLRISGAPAVGDSAPAAPPPIGVAAPAAPARIGGLPRPGAIGAPAQPAVPGKKPNFGLGLLGAVIGASLGSVICLLVYYYGGIHMRILARFLALGVGYLAGAGAELLGRKEGSKELGVIAAVLTLVGLVGAQYVGARHWWHSEVGDVSEMVGSAYDMAMEESKKVVAAIPNGTDQEIRDYLAKESVEEGEKPDPKAITDEEVKQYRDTTLKEMQSLASGKVTKADYLKKVEDETKKVTHGLTEEGTFKAYFMILMLTPLNLISLAIGAGVAFKVSSKA